MDCFLPAERLPVPQKAFSTDTSHDILSFAVQVSAAGHRVALCTLVEIRGGSSRALGAHMAVSDDGLYCGYVSGGCTEAAVAAEALAAIAKGCDRYVMLGEGSPFFDIVLPCGGGITIAVHILRDLQPIAATIDRLKKRMPAALRYEPQTQSLVSGQEDKPTGWDGAAFITHYRPGVRVLLSGRTLEVEVAARVAEAAGYDVVCHDPAAGETLNAGIVDNNTAIALLHHDIEVEIPVLDVALKTHPFYLGALGSARTHEKRVQRLREMGYTEEAIAQIRAPIGLFGRARDAQSLALSVLADIASCQQTR
jgi:xanthine dehydrogenase accessory factor